MCIMFYENYSNKLLCCFVLFFHQSCQIDDEIILAKFCFVATLALLIQNRT